MRPEAGGGVKAASLRADTRGATMVEYLIAIAVVGIAALGAWHTFGGDVDQKTDAQGVAIASMAADTSGAAVVGGGTEGLEAATAALVSSGSAPPDGADPGGASEAGGDESFLGSTLGFGWGTVKGLAGGAWDTVTGLVGLAGDVGKGAWWVVTNPGEAAGGVAHAVTHPGETASAAWGFTKAAGSAIWGALGDAWETAKSGSSEERGMLLGAGIFEVAMTVGTGGTGHASKARWLGKVDDVARAADDVSDTRRAAALAAAARRADDVHRRITHDLYRGRVVDARPFSADNNRNSLFWARIENNGRRSEALFKPRHWGDGDGWNRVPMEYVAYEINRKLGMDYVPPVAYRRDFDIDFQRFSEGALMHKVEDAKPLRNVPVERWGVDRDLFLSDVQVLDVLLQNADRHAGNYMIGKHWVDGSYRPALIDHAASLRPGTNIRMDVPGALADNAVTTVRRQTLERLRALERKDLRRTLGEFVSDAEIDGILSRRDGVVRYFENLARERGAAAVIKD